MTAFPTDPAEWKALTLYQPHPSLFAYGPRTIETRPRGTDWRGWLMIHAALKAPWGEHLTALLDALAHAEGGPSFMGRPDRWWDGTIWLCPNGHASTHFLATEKHGGVCLACRDKRGVVLVPPEWGYFGDMPLGAVVAVARLTDVVPVVEEDSSFDEKGNDVYPPLIEVADSGAELRLWWPACAAPGSEADEVDITDQLPYGDFTPGRRGWLLADITPLREPVSEYPCPEVGWAVWDDEGRESYVCKRCNATGVAKVKGKQAAPWQPDADLVAAVLEQLPQEPTP